MKKYIFEEKIGLTYNASSKARDDIDFFIKRYKDKNGNSYNIIGENDKTKVKTSFGKAVLGIKSILSLLRMKKDDILFVQSSFRILKKIDVIKKIVGFRTIYLVHDLDALRDSYLDACKVDDMIKELDKQDVVILHNDKMIAELRSRGCQTNLVNLELFDYYVDPIPPISNHRNRKFELCFAGNLSPNKTGFLYALDDRKTNYKINVYGRKERECKRHSYIGCFNPEVLPQELKGDFGLIWEGNQFVYDESEHPYIMYNNPHKASLYIVSGLPIIVWEKAAIADFVTRKGIGITVSNIEEIEAKLEQLSDFDYEEMKKNLECIRRDLVEGKHLHNAIRIAEKILNV